MSELVLHRVSSPAFRGSYSVSDLPLTIQRIRPRGWWWVTAHLSVDHPWVQRNPGLLNTRFPTLRECRQALDAILAVDPLDHKRSLISGPTRRVAPGRYRFKLNSGREGEAYRHPNGTWQVRVKTPSGWKNGQLAYESLWRARATSHLDDVWLPSDLEDLSFVGYEE